MDCNILIFNPKWIIRSSIYFIDNKYPDCFTFSNHDEVSDYNHTHAPGLTYILNL